MIPFAMIYMVTALYGIVDYIGLSDWPALPVVNLLSGGLANTIIYSLILLVILKMKRDPQVTIPVFLAVSIFYLLVLDKLVYIYFGSGIAVSMIKTAKYSVFIFFLIYEFFYEGKKTWVHAALALVLGFFMHGLVTFLLALFVFLGNNHPAAFFKASERVLKSGFSFPLERVETEIIENSSFGAVPMLIKYSKLYNRNIKYTRDDWQKILSKTSAVYSEKIIFYLHEKSIKLDYSFFMEKIVIKIGDGRRYSNFSRYATRYLEKHRKQFYQTIETGSRFHKVWAMEVAALAHDIESMPYLIDKLSSVDAELSVNAYSALKMITGIDPAQNEGYHANSPVVIAKFREFYQGYHKDL